MTFYENMKACCAKHGTTITKVLDNIGRASSSTGTWKAGRYPRLDIVQEMADYLGVSIEELIYGEDAARETAMKILNQNSTLTDEQVEWLYVLSRIPESKRQVCLDFLKTHMIEPEDKEGKKGGGMSA